MVYHNIKLLIIIACSIFGLVHCHEYDYASEQLIWEDNFEFIDESKWIFKVTDFAKEDLGFYRRNVSNQYVSEGVLHLDHTFTGFDYGEEFLYTGELDLFTLDPEHPCTATNNADINCYQSTGPDILPPMTANRMETSGKFEFKYGRIEIKAKSMLGDWVRLALWMKPVHHVYGNAPANGEIDILENTGSRYYQCAENSRGVDWFQDNMHYGPSSENCAHFPAQHWDHENSFADEWHTFGILWTDTYLAFMLDGIETRRITPPEGGLWELWDFEGENIYKDGNVMAPFDQEFYFVLSTHPGGQHSPWPFDSKCDPPLPWDPNSEDPKKQFWEARDEWISSFTQPFLIDYIKVFQDEYQISHK